MRSISQSWNAFTGGYQEEACVLVERVLLDGRHSVCTGRAPC